MTRRTPLHEAHRRRGGRMVDFAGWEMPVQYSGILNEHHAVRTHAGLFDVSHMGEIEVRGAAALATCQAVTCNDVRRLADGDAQYNLLLRPSGGVVDDVVIHRRGDDRFLLCVNAANRQAAFDHLREYADDALVVDCSDEYGQLAVQGPLSTPIVSGLTGVDLGSLSRFTFAETRVADVEVLLAHTGYTGEDGWELYCAASSVVALWERLLEAGEPLGLVPAGLGARDTLRLEAALPLYGHELTAQTTPLEARLEWVVKMDKGEFLGRSALAGQRQNGFRKKLVGLMLAEPGVPRHGYPILAGGRAVGEVTSGTMSPTLGKGIALGYVEPDCTEIGTSLDIEIRRRAVPAAVVSLPFYKRKTEARKFAGT